MLSPRFRRNILVAFLFGLIWASIQYTQGRVTDLGVLALSIAVFTVAGSLLCWCVQTAVDWFKRRQ